MAEITGGLLMPTMWWGAGGGHERFKWTFYQDPDAARSIVLDTVQNLIRFGSRVIVLLEGHYPWEGLLNGPGGLDTIRRAHPEVLILDGNEVSITEDGSLPPGDHAALQETLYGLDLLGELIDLAALHPGRSEQTSWPSDVSVETLTRFPGVEYDASKPNFAQMGASALDADRMQAEKQVNSIVESVTKSIKAHLEE